MRGVSGTGVVFPCVFREANREATREMPRMIDDRAASPSPILVGHNLRSSQHPRAAEPLRYIRSNRISEAAVTTQPDAAFADPRRALSTHMVL